MPKPKLKLKINLNKKTPKNKEPKITVSGNIKENLHVVEREPIKQKNIGFWSKLKITRNKEYIKLKKTFLEYFKDPMNKNLPKELFTETLKKYNYDYKLIEKKFEVFTRFISILYGELKIDGHNRKILFKDYFSKIPAIEPKNIEPIFKELRQFTNESNILHFMREDNFIKLLNYLNFDIKLLKHKGSYYRVKNILEKPFGLQELYQFIERKKSNSKKEFIFSGKPAQLDNTHIIRKGNIIYRNFDRKKYELWKKLYDLGLPVEPIIGLASIQEAKSIGYDIKKYNNQVFVKSRVLQGPTLYELTVSRKLTPFERKSIGLQVDSILERLWNLGLLHGHPHPHNFIVVFKDGKPKVHLIDFDLIKPLTKDEFRYDMVYYDAISGIPKNIRNTETYNRIIHS